MSDEILIKAENVSKKFCRRLRKSLWYGLKDMASEAMGGSRSHDELRPDEFWAVKDVSFELRRGECLGLIGHNGAGKTTLLKMLNGLIKPDHGSITMRGRVGALIALGAGFNPILTGHENIYVNGAVLGLSRAQVAERIEEIIEFAEIGDFIDSPVQTYSSGMHVRLGFAAATHLIQPEILILDEVLAVGDSAFRAKCELKVSELVQDAAVILVSHSSPAIRKLCDRILWLRHGRMQPTGGVGETISKYEQALRANSASESGVVKCPAIHDVEFHCPKTDVQSGDLFALQFKLKCPAPISAGSLYLGFNDGDQSAALCEIRGPLTLEPYLSYTISTGPLQLRPGTYRVNLAIYGSSMKHLLLRVHPATVLHVTGGAMASAYYTIPGELKAEAIPES